jgi:hypothetical protein
MKQPSTRVQCARSPDGMHELTGYAQVSVAPNPRFPGSTELYVVCRHCGANGRGWLKNHQIEWPDAEKVPE